MARIDYTTILNDMGTMSEGAAGPVSAPVYISFPFRDFDPQSEYVWQGEKGFKRFLAVFSPQAIIGTDATTGEPILADNISYLQEISTSGLAAVNIGTLCRPNWVGSLVSTGFDTRKSYWVRFNDDINNPVATSLNNTDSWYLQNSDFYDFENALNGQDWGTNTVTGWAFRKPVSDHAPSKVIEGLDLIESGFKIYNPEKDEVHWLCYPYSDDSATSSEENEFNLEYPDQLFSSIIGESTAAAYVEGSSVWGGSLTKLEPGRGYNFRIKDGNNFDTSIINPVDNSVKVFTTSNIPTYGVDWYDFPIAGGTSPFGLRPDGTAYHASNYSFEEVVGKNNMEFTNPEGFAGFVNWGYHEGAWNPDNLPSTGIYAFQRGINHSLGRFNAILNPDFSNIGTEEGHVGESFYFMAYYDPYRDEHFVFNGFRYLTTQDRDNGFCNNDDGDDYPDYAIHDIRGFGGFKQAGNSNPDKINCGSMWGQNNVDNAFQQITLGNQDTETPYWTTDGTINGPLYPEYSKQRGLMLSGAHPEGLDQSMGPDMPWTWVFYHAPHRKFYQLRPAHVRYKVLNNIESEVPGGPFIGDADYSDAFFAANAEKVMHFWMDNHRNTSRGKRWEEEYSGSDMEGSWTAQPGAGSGWRELDGISCVWGDAGTFGCGFHINNAYFTRVNTEGNIEPEYVSNNEGRFNPTGQLYVEYPCQLVIQTTNSIIWYKKLSDIVMGPFERDVDKTVEGG